MCSNSISIVVVDESAFSSSASNPNISRPTTLRDGGEVGFWLCCARAPFGACLEWRGVDQGGSVQVSVHFLWHVFKLGVASFSDFAGCRQLSVPLRRMFELLFVCASLVCHGRSSFLERIACCAKSTHKEVFVSTRTHADLNAPRD